MPDLSQPLVWIAAISAALCVGMSKTGFGGLGIFAVVLFASIWPARESTGALLPLMIAADFVGVYFYRRHAHWPDLWKLFPATFAGILCGWWLMPRISDATFTNLLGWIVLALLTLNIAQRHFPQLLESAAHHPLLGLAAGWASGVATMMANAAGAITAFYFLARRMDKMTFVGTIAWFFLVVNLSKVPFSLQLGLINPASLGFDLMLLPAVLAGALLGRFLLQRVSQQTFEWITIGLAMLAAARLIVFG
jgi:uncharacterized membrane protein YfcA